MRQSGRHWRPTLLVAIVVVLFGAVLPLVDDYVQSWPSHRSRGGQIDLRFEGRQARTGATSGYGAVSLVAPASWQPVRSAGGTERALLISHGASLDMRLVPASTVTDCRVARADAERTLSVDLGATTSGASQQLALADGGSGVLTGFSSGLVDGFVFLACTEGAALVATATVPAGARATTVDDLDDLLATVRFR